MINLVSLDLCAFHYGKESVLKEAKKKVICLLMICLYYNAGNPTEDSFGSIGKQATITIGSSSYFYVNPALFDFSVTLISYGSKSKIVNSSDWVKRMQKQTTRAQFLDMELEFVPGKYHSCVRLLRQEKGLLEV